jgi:hypothetical protein
VLRLCTQGDVCVVVLVVVVVVIVLAVWMIQVRSTPLRGAVVEVVVINTIRMTWVRSTPLRTAVVQLAVHRDAGAGSLREAESHSEHSSGALHDPVKSKTARSSVQEVLARVRVIKKAINSQAPFTPSSFSSTGAQRNRELGAHLEPVQATSKRNCCVKSVLRMALGDARVGAAIAAVVAAASAAVLLHARVAKKAPRRKQACVGTQT